jgi:hypothetical protein
VVPCGDAAQACLHVRAADAVLQHVACLVSALDVIPVLAVCTRGGKRRGGGRLRQRSKVEVASM